MDGGDPNDPQSGRRVDDAWGFRASASPILERGNQMSEFYTGKTIRAKSVSPGLRQPLPYLSGSVEQEDEQVKIPETPDGKPSPQSPSTEKSDVTGPQGENREIIFTTYSPLDNPKNPGLFGLIPPDMSGADSSPGVVLYTGNTYLGASNDGGRQP